MEKEEKELTEAKTKADVEKEMKEGNISLILEDYQDIFSDFDPRPYSEKALSDDFLQECKRAVRDKKEGFELRLLIPKKARNASSESKIRTRLNEHFAHHFWEKSKEISNIKKQGILWFLLGTALLMAETLLYQYDSFFLRLIKTMMIPAGWFSFWEGLGKIFITSREKSPELEFYKKMASCKIYFLSY